MGAPAGVDELCEDARFQAFLAGALAQQGRGVSTLMKGFPLREGRGWRTRRVRSSGTRPPSC